MHCVPFINVTIRLVITTILYKTDATYIRTLVLYLYTYICNFDFYILKVHFILEKNLHSLVVLTVTYAVLPMQHYAKEQFKWLKWGFVVLLLVYIIQN